MQLQAPVVGASFRPSEAKDIIKQLTIGEFLSLEREPENQYDIWAVKVLVGDIHIGYVPRDTAPVVAAALDEGFEPMTEIVAFQSTLKPVVEITWDE